VSVKIYGKSAIADEARYPPGANWNVLQRCPFCAAPRTELGLKNSTTRAGITPRATRTEAARAYNDRVLAATGLTADRNKYNRVQRLKAELRVALGNERGECSIGGPNCTKVCTEIDHMNPSLKRAVFGNLLSYKQVFLEVRRNTVDGVVFLQGVCRICHETKSKNDRPAASPTAMQQLKRDFVDSAKRALRVCADRNCPIPWMECTEGVEFLFHMDHLHTLNCASSGKGCASGTGCVAEPSLRKVAGLSEMVKTSTYNLSDVKAEMDPRKVQMLHTSCHMLVTKAQQARGVVNISRAAPEMKSQDKNSNRLPPQTRAEHVVITPRLYQPRQDKQLRRALQSVGELLHPADKTSRPLTRKRKRAEDADEVC
jgi:hypothetical protein